MRTAAIVACFLLLFLLVYLAGYFSLESGQAVQQYWKGFIKFGIHFLFLLLGVIYLSRRSTRFYLRTIGFFTAGMVLQRDLRRPAAPRSALGHEPRQPS